MTGLDLLAPWLAIVALFVLLRRLEIWLHQHIFKVGWLLTRQNRTTTVLYYVFFLPGIILNQLVIWMVAGFLNVRADRALAWPEQTEIGELKLDFVRVAPDAGDFRLALIHSTPLAAGLIATALIATNVLGVREFQSALSRGTLTSVVDAFRRFTSAPDFWLWLYLAFTIANTMMPDFGRLRGWRTVIVLIGIIVIVLYLVGVGDQVVMGNLRQPVLDAVNALSALFLAIIALNVSAVAVLGLVESVIERITGHSATFEHGHLVTFTRQEMLAKRAAERQAATVHAKQPAARSRSSPTSVYSLPFPIPGPPGREAVRREPDVMIAPAETPGLPARTIDDPRAGASVIPGATSDRPKNPPQPGEVFLSPRPIRAAGPFASQHGESPQEEAGRGVEEDELPSIDDVTYEDYEDPA